MSEAVFETDRLTIREWTEGDVARLLEIYSDPEVTEHLPECTLSNLEEAQTFLTRLVRTYTSFGDGYGLWAAVRKNDGLPVGTVLLKHLPGEDGVGTSDVEVGWHLARECWNRGYATEMALGALAHGFTRQGDSVIWAVTEEENLRSLAVMERLGMAHRGMTRAYYGMECVLYEMTAERWRALRSSP